MAKQPKDYTLKPSPSNEGDESPKQPQSALAIFSPASVDRPKVRVLTTQIVSPKAMQVGQAFTARIKGFRNSGVSTYKTRLIDFVTIGEKPIDFVFPCTAVISRALGFYDGKELLEGKPLETEEAKWVGRVLYVEKTGEKKGEKGKKNTQLFNVGEVMEQE